MPDGSWLSGRPSFFLFEIINAFYYQSFDPHHFSRALLNMTCVLYVHWLSLSDDGKCQASIFR
jgi:hypothetical protein